MSEQVNKEHALTLFMQSQGTARAAAPGVSVLLQPNLSHVNLRMDPHDLEAVALLKSLVSTPLPEPGQVERGEITIYWLGPQEFLMVSPVIGSDLVRALSDVLKHRHAAATDLSGGQILLKLSGLSVRDFLCKASTLDFHSQVFAENSCAQSTFAKTGALFARVERDDFELVVRRSFADYAARWMLSAGQEFGIVFDE